MTANLCKCNNCDTVLIDQNPQIGAPELNLTGDEQEMQYDSSYGGWVCPNCMVDDYLVDVGLN
jgi:hypothetical protein